MDVMVELFVEW